MTEMPAHSPLGGSGVARYLACPGSVRLSYGVHDEEDDTFSTPGLGAHALAAECLERGRDAWQSIGDTYVVGSFDDPKEVEVDKEMADAVQVYLNAARSEHIDLVTLDSNDSINKVNTWIEHRFHCPSIHELHYGTADLAHLDLRARQLDIWDYKHGAGIVVEVKQNEQCMYYATGVLESFDLWKKVDRVVLHIAQPRGFHFDGPLRHWSISTNELEDWLEDTLVPGMNLALTSRETQSGEHCRFCPARARACPQILKDMEELETMVELFHSEDAAKKLTPKQIGRYKDLLEVAKIVGKAADRTAYAMMSGGKIVPGWQLGKKKSNRVWKDGAQEDLIDRFGKKAWVEKKLRSPAKIDELPMGKAATERWAFKPEAGLTVMRASDARPAVSQDTKSLFKAQTKKGKK